MLFVVYINTTQLSGLFNDGLAYSLLGLFFEFAD